MKLNLRLLTEKLYRKLLEANKTYDIVIPIEGDTDVVNAVIQNNHAFSVLKQSTIKTTSDSMEINATIKTHSLVDDSSNSKQCVDINLLKTDGTTVTVVLDIILYDKLKFRLSRNITSSIKISNKRKKIDKTTISGNVVNEFKVFDKKTDRINNHTRDVSLPLLKPTKELDNYSSLQIDQEIMLFKSWDHYIKSNATKDGFSYTRFETSFTALNEWYEVDPSIKYSAISYEGECNNKIPIDISKIVYDKDITEGVWVLSLNGNNFKGTTPFSFFWVNYNAPGTATTPETFVDVKFPILLTAGDQIMCNAGDTHRGLLSEDIDVMTQQPEFHAHGIPDKIREYSKNFNYGSNILRFVDNHNHVKQDINSVFFIHKIKASDGKYTVLIEHVPNPNRLTIFDYVDMSDISGWILKNNNLYDIDNIRTKQYDVKNSLTTYSNNRFTPYINSSSINIRINIDKVHNGKEVSLVSPNMLDIKILYGDDVSNSQILNELDSFIKMRRSKHLLHNNVNPKNDLNLSVKSHLLIDKVETHFKSFSNPYVDINLPSFKNKNGGVLVHDGHELVEKVLNGSKPPVSKYDSSSLKISPSETTNVYSDKIESIKINYEDGDTNSISTVVFMTDCVLNSPINNTTDFVSGSMIIVDYGSRETTITNNNRTVNISSNYSEKVSNDRMTIIPNLTLKDLQNDFILFDKYGRLSSASFDELIKGGPYKLYGDVNSPIVIMTDNYLLVDTDLISKDLSNIQDDDNFSITVKNESGKNLDVILDIHETSQFKYELNKYVWMNNYKPNLKELITSLYKSEHYIHNRLVSKNPVSAIYNDKDKFAFSVNNIILHKGNNKSKIVIEHCMNTILNNRVANSFSVLHLEKLDFTVPNIEYDIVCFESYQTRHNLVITGLNGWNTSVHDPNTREKTVEVLLDGVVVSKMNDGVTPVTYMDTLLSKEDMKSMNTYDMNTYVILRTNDPDVISSTRSFKMTVSKTLEGLKEKITVNLKTVRNQFVRFPKRRFSHPMDSFRGDYFNNIINVDAMRSYSQSNTPSKIIYLDDSMESAIITVDKDNLPDDKDTYEDTILIRTEKLSKDIDIFIKPNLSSTKKKILISVPMDYSYFVDFSKDKIETHTDPSNDDNTLVYGNDKRNIFIKTEFKAANPLYKSHIITGPPERRPTAIDDVNIGNISHMLSPTILSSTVGDMYVDSKYTVTENPMKPSGETLYDSQMNHLKKYGVMDYGIDNSLYILMDANNTMDNTHYRLSYNYFFNKLSLAAVDPIIVPSKTLSYDEIVGLERSHSILKVDKDTSTKTRTILTPPTT